MSATYRSLLLSHRRKRKLIQNIYLSHAPHTYKRRNGSGPCIGKQWITQQTIGGPSVKPYQPPGLWELATSGRGLLATYRQDHGASLYRRGLYTFIKRTVPPPSMMIFDASNRDQCEVNRPRTNTPLQALIMMNDPTVLESSKAMADLLIQEKKKPEATVTEAFMRIINRHPQKNETDLLLLYLTEQQIYFNTHPEEVKKITNVGEYKAKTTASPVLAATMQMIQVIYNMDEAITKT